MRSEPDGDVAWGLESRLGTPLIPALWDISPLGHIPCSPPPTHWIHLATKGQATQGDNLLIFQPIRTFWCKGDLLIWVKPSYSLIPFHLKHYTYLAHSRCFVQVYTEDTWIVLLSPFALKKELAQNRPLINSWFLSLSPLRYFILLLITQEIMMEAAVKNICIFKNFRPVCIGKPNTSSALKGELTSFTDLLILLGIFFPCSIVSSSKFWTSHLSSMGLSQAFRDKGKSGHLGS